MSRTSVAISRNNSRLAIAVQYASRRPPLPHAASLRLWAHAACETELAVTLRIVNEAEGRKLNRVYRHRDYATNVLTFTYGETKSLSGDIVLCAPVIGREAREQRKAPLDHYAHLVIHGMLHLQGYDHEVERAARRMEARESAILISLGLDDPYARC